MNSGWPPIESARERLRELLATQAVRWGRFTLASGRTSTYFIDAKLVTLSAEGSLLAGRVLFEAVREWPVTGVGGITMGADPLVTAVTVVSQLAGRPLAGFLVRKDPKEYATKRLVEGPQLPPGAKVVVVDDAITTGGRTLSAVAAARQLGYEVAGALALVDRLEGAAENFSRAGVHYRAVYTIRDLGVAPINR